MKKAIDLIRQQSSIELPSYAVPVLATNAIYIADNLAHIADNGDYSSLEDIRKTIEFLADQFGGKAVWDEKSSELYKIIINGASVALSQQILSYEDICHLVSIDPFHNPTCTFEGRNGSGVLSGTDRLDLKVASPCIINCIITGNA